MATKLQQALAGVNPPKVPLSEIRGKTFQAQQQHAVNIQQTNLGQQIPELIKTGGKMYGQYVDASWEQAKQVYDEAKLADKDPLKVAAEYAGKESNNLLTRTKAILQESLGIDPLAYTRAYTAEKYAENQAFQTDAMIQEKIKAGDFATVEDMKTTRQTLRKDIAKDVAGSVGLKSSNAFILKGATKNEQQSEQALVMQQTAVEDQNLRNTRKQMAIESFNTMLNQGVQDPAVFKQLLDDGLTDGTFNTSEHYQMMGQFAQSLADTGNTSILNGFLNQSIKLGNGETKKFGDVLPVEIRDGLFLKADEMWLENNKELYDKYSRQLGMVSVDMENGNTGSAMARIDQLDSLLNANQGSGRVTSQMKHLMQLRNQVLVGAARQNNIKKAANDKVAKDMKQQGDYAEAITTAMMGGIATTDWSAMNISQENAMVATRQMIDHINQSDLAPEQKMRQMGQLISVLPDRAEARKAFSEFAQRGVDAATQALAQAQYSKTGEIPQLPVESESLIKQYKNDPALFQKVVSPQVFEQTAVLANGVDKVGWDTYARSKAQPLAFTQNDTDNFTGYVQDLQRSQLFSGPQLDTIMTRAKENVRFNPDYKSDPEAAIKRAVQEAALEQQQMTVQMSKGVDLIPRSVLIPSGQAEAVPLVQAQLEDKITKYRDKATLEGDRVYVTHDTQGRIGIMSTFTGKSLEVTSAETLLREAGDNVNAQMEAQKIRKKAEFDKALLKAQLTKSGQDGRIRPSGIPSNAKY